MTSHQQAFKARYPLHIRLLSRIASAINSHLDILVAVSKAYNWPLVDAGLFQWLDLPPQWSLEKVRSKNGTAGIVACLGLLELHWQWKQQRTQSKPATDA